MNKAVFLDRDGVINPLVYNIKTGEYESPNYAYEFSIYTYAIKAMKRLQDAGYMLFLISNQPSYAKGKTTMENLCEIHRMLDQYLRENDVNFTKYYYCYHHPNGTVPEYTGNCECRKPGTKSIDEAQSKYDIDKTNSWFIGDQDTDVQCGHAAGLKTIQIVNPHSVKKRGKSICHYMAEDLIGAVEIIF